MSPPDLRDQLQNALGTAYLIERELGGGGMSRVFVAEDTTLGRKVVIKLLAPDLPAGVSADRFKREIRIAALLQHPHIVPLLSAGDSNGLPYYSMPLVAGESLRERISRSGELPIADAVRLLRGIADALAYAHEHGVVHRDIKPENVLVSGDHALVTDFGVAKAMSDAAPSGALTSVGIALGTPAYMAPEQGAGDPSTDHRADIYAFGVLAYEVLAGQPPFAGRAAAALIAAHATEAPTPLARVRPSIDGRLAALMMHCLEKRPADRPQTAREIVRELDAMTSSGAIAPSVTMLRVTSRRVSRWMIAGSVAVVALVLAGAAWFHWRPEKVTRKRVAVIPFENLTGDTTLAQVGRIAADWITQGAAQVDSVDVVSTATVEGIIGDGKGSTTDAARRVGATTHASAIVTGTVSRFGDSLRVSAEVVDARSGQVIRALQSVSGPVSDPIVAIQALRERLLGSFASGDLQRRTRLGTEPPRYSAYEEYVEGSDRFVRYHDWPGARRRLEKAIELDSTFAAPWVMLALTLRNLELYDESDSVARRAEALRTRFTQEEHLQLAWVRSILDRDVERELNLSTQIAQLDSSHLWLYSVGITALWLLRPSIAIPALRASESGSIAAGDWPQFRDLGAAYHAAGDYRSELATYERGTKAFPTITWPYTLSALAGLGRAEQGVRFADSLLTTTTRYGPAVYGVLGGAEEFGAHGDTTTEQRLARLVTVWFKTHASSSAAAAITRAHAWYLAGGLDSAAAVLRTLPRDSVTLTRVAALALVDAQRGDSSRARLVADSLAGTHPKWDFGQTTYWRAVIVARLGDKQQAVQLLRDANRQGRPMNTWHADEALAPLRGYRPFEALITPQK
jgi:serine/threonine-protein kinase